MMEITEERTGVFTLGGFAATYKSLALASTLLALVMAVIHRDRSEKA